MFQAAKENLAGTLDITQRELARAVTDHLAVRTERDHLEASLEEKADKIDTLRTQLEEAVRKLREHEAHSATLRTSEAAFQEALKAKTEECRAALVDVSKLREQLREANELRGDHVKQLEHARKQVQTEAEFRRLSDDQLVELRAELAKKDIELQSVRIELDRVKHLKQSLKKEARDCRAQLAEENTKRLSAEARVAELEQADPEITFLERQMRTIQQSLETRRASLTVSTFSIPR